MGEDFVATAQNMPGTAAVVNAVSKDKWGIGYGGSAYGKGIRELKVKDGGTRHRVRPDDGEYQERASIRSAGSCTCTWCKKRPTGALKKYIDWMLGDEGQKIVNEVGYFPIR